MRSAKCKWEPWIESKRNSYIRTFPEEKTKTNKTKRKRKENKLDTSKVHWTTQNTHIQKTHMWWSAFYVSKFFWETTKKVKKRQNERIRRKNLSELIVYRIVWWGANDCSQFELFLNVFFFVYTGAIFHLFGPMGRFNTLKFPICSG